MRVKKEHTFFFRKGRGGMETWHGVRIYDELGFDRKLRRERKTLLWEEVTGGSMAPVNELVEGQMMDLIEGLGLPRRFGDVLRLKVKGYTLRETAAEMGVSRQRVERIWHGIQARLSARKDHMEDQMIPGRVPHYGWQEVYLASQRPHGGRACSTPQRSSTTREE